MLMKCKKMPPETLLLSVVAEQPDIFQDICKSFCQKCYNWYYCGGGGCLFTISWRLMKGSGQRQTWILVNKMKGGVGVRFFI